MGIVGDRVCDNHARLVQIDLTFCCPFLPSGATKQRLLRVQRAHGGPFANKGAKLGHLGQNHGHDFQRINLVIRKAARVFGLNNQNAHRLAQALNRHAKEAGEDLLAGFRHETKAFGRRRVRLIHWVLGAGDAAHKAFADAHPGLVDGFGVQTFCGTQLQRIGIAKQIDRADFRAHLIGNDMSDAVKPFLPCAILGQSVAQTSKKFAAFAVCALCQVSPHFWSGPSISELR